MKILFIVEKYAPNSSIAAVRPSKLVKYLAKEFGHEIDLLTTQEETDDSYLANTIHMPKCNSLLDKILNVMLTKRKKTVQQNLLAARSSKREGKARNSLKLWLRRMAEKVFYVLRFLATVASSKKQVRAFSKQLDINKFAKYDVIISSYSPLYAHLIARKISIKFGCIWISDFRDPIYGGVIPKAMRPLCRHYAKMITRKSDCTVVVSNEGHESYDIAKSAKIKVVSNGFDIDDYATLSNLERGNVLTLTYAGTFYKNGSSLLRVMQAVSRLIKSNRIEKEKIKIVYIGRQPEWVMAWANDCEICDRVFAGGQVTRQESLELLSKSDINLLTVWNRSDSKGIISGKYYELLALKRPILAEITGDIPNAEVVKMIKETNAGYCYEECISNGDTNELEQQIMLWYNEKMTTGIVECRQNAEIVARYNYRNLAAKLNDIISEVKEEREHKIADINNR